MILYTLHNNGYIDFSEKVKLFPKEKFNMYVNFTNRCNCNCTFCLRHLKNDHKLWLKDGEPSLEEIKQIRANIPDDLEIETFIHGAMCISYSGRCLLSNFFTGCVVNQGACTHPCRWKYSIVEETRPGEYMPVYENERGTYIFNSKDLCMIEHMDDILTSGIDSLKIEGRMKTALYVATVARTYRKAIDDYFESPKLYRENMEWYKEQIMGCT